MMIKLRDGVSSCREHGGEYAGDLAALDHLQTEHPDLAKMLAGAVMLPVPDGENPAPPSPNRAARRARR